MLLGFENVPWSVWFVQHYIVRLLIFLWICLMFISKLPNINFYVESTFDFFRLLSWNTQEVWNTVIDGHYKWVQSSNIGFTGDLPLIQLWSKSIVPCNFFHTNKPLFLTLFFGQSTNDNDHRIQSREILFENDIAVFESK